MNKIELKQVLPNVFRSRNDIVSEVWHKEIEFCKGEKCLKFMIIYFKIY